MLESKENEITEKINETEQEQNISECIDTENAEITESEPGIKEPKIFDSYEDMIKRLKDDVKNLKKVKKQQKKILKLEEKRKEVLNDIERKREIEMKLKEKNRKRHKKH